MVMFSSPGLAVRINSARCLERGGVDAFPTKLSNAAMRGWLPRAVAVRISQNHGVVIESAEAVFVPSWGTLLQY